MTEVAVTFGSAGAPIIFSGALEALAEALAAKVPAHLGELFPAHLSPAHRIERIHAAANAGLFDLSGGIAA